MTHLELDQDSLSKVAWLMEGKELQNTDGEIVKLSGFEVSVEDESMNQVLSEDADFIDFEIYIDARDEQISELKEIIRQQMEEMQKLLAKKEGRKPRKAYVKLTMPEEKEIAKFIKDNPEMTYVAIAELHEISQSAAHRISERYRCRRVLKKGSKDVKPTEGNTESK